MIIGWFFVLDLSTTFQSAEIPCPSMFRCRCYRYNHVGRLKYNIVGKREKPWKNPQRYARTKLVFSPDGKLERQTDFAAVERLVLRNEYFINGVRYKPINLFSFPLDNISYKYGNPEPYDSGGGGILRWKHVRVKQTKRLFQKRFYSVLVILWNEWKIFTIHNYTVDPTIFEIFLIVIVGRVLVKRLLGSTRILDLT